MAPGAGSKFLAMKKVHVTLLGLFGASRCNSAPPKWYGPRGIAPLRPLAHLRYSRACVPQLRSYLWLIQ